MPYREPQEVTKQEEKRSCALCKRSITGAIVPYLERYPRYVCEVCCKRLCDEDNRPLAVDHEVASQGFIDGWRCSLSEARFWHTVVELLDDAPHSSVSLAGSLSDVIRAERARAKLTSKERTRSRQEIRIFIQGIEEEIAARNCFTFNEDGFATLTTNKRRFDAGRFEIISIGALKQKLQSLPKREHATLRLSAMFGSDPMTDIGYLQATASPNTLFQVASQFNCLESPGPYLVPVSDYVNDPTQGPRASISAFPATLLRHHAAPSPVGPFTQQKEAQLNLLSDALDDSSAEVKSGYLTTQHIKNPQKLVQQLEERFDEIKVGVHERAQVVYGYNWGGPIPERGTQHISQAFTSTMALGGYSNAALTPVLTDACIQLLRAAYLGTILSAISLNMKTVVLTLIGGGAFGNPIPIIWDAILWAVGEANRYATDEVEILVNLRTIPAELPQHKISKDIRERAGVLLELTPDGLSLRR
jgi:hypothetical protein